MKYSNDKASNNELSRLGLGCMRFTRDKAETERMILTAIDNGVNYFDSAYIYPGSEETFGEIIAKHNKRNNIYIATKLPMIMCKKAEDFDKFFNRQLQRLQTDFIDYYMLHNVSSLTQWETFKAMGIEDWLAEKRSTGNIRYIGFSFHGSYDEFCKILDAYAWDFCMIQYNYYDMNYQAGKKGLHAAADKGLSVMVMEPLLGGRLATGLPQQAIDIFKKVDPDRTPADWALQWLWNQDEVTVVVSGMNNQQQMESNIRSLDGFRPLNDDELAVYDNVVELFRKSYRIPCTSCDYCIPCPKGINISSCFSAYNTSYSQGYMAGIALYMNSIAVFSKSNSSPRNCINCGRCEKQCPQNISIVRSLKKAARRFEPYPFRPVLSLVRSILSR